jgi:DNA invertase Pin-like site-specific DNA recombinase
MKSDNIGPEKNLAKVRPQYVSYVRCSTAGQAASGLGIEAQQAAVRRHCADGALVAEFTEQESGKRTDRPQLTLALAECRRRRATLVCAKLDRLSRNVRFVATLLESNVPLVFCDMPTADRMVLQMMSVVAEREAAMISARTKAALQAARERGVRLGGSYRFNSEQIAKGRQASAALRSAKARERALDIMPVVHELREQGKITLAAIADGLNERGITTARGCKWSTAAVYKLQNGSK